MAASILIVDDSAFVRQMLRDILTDEGCEIVAEAANGAEAVVAYRLHRPDLVTMDMIMPEVGGLDALGEILAMDPAARVVMISAVEQRPLLQEALKRGAADYIVKPFERDRVVEAIRRVASE